MARDDTVNERDDRRRRARWTLVLLFVVFLAPVVGGSAWFYFGHDFSQKNHGTLYDPARLVEDVAFRAAGSGESALADLRGKWLLVYVGQGACDEACLTRLDAISRVRISLAKNIKRVMPVYLAGVAPDPAAVARIRAAMPTGIIAGLGAGGLDGLLAQLVRQGEAPTQALRRVYLIDPIGNLVLSYEPGADPAGIRKDLARLLRVSQIG